MVKQGHIIWVDFDPQLGHEQQGRRPALVVNNDDFYKSTSMVIVCPITKTNRKHLFHIALDDRTKTSGIILCEQVRSIDISVRNYKFIEVIPKDILSVVCDTVCGFTYSGNQSSP